MCKKLLQRNEPRVLTLFIGCLKKYFPVHWPQAYNPKVDWPKLSFSEKYLGIIYIKKQTHKQESKGQHWKGSREKNICLVVFILKKNMLNKDCEEIQNTLSLVKSYVE